MKTDMNENFDEFHLDNIIKGEQRFKILLSENVKEDIKNGRITLDTIEFSLLDIPDSVYKSVGKEEFLIDCKNAKTRLILSKNNETLKILIAKKAEDFKIY